MAQRHCCPFLPPFRFLLTSFAHWMRSWERPWKGRITIGVEWKHLPGTSRRYKRHSLLFPFLPRDKGALWNDRPKYSQPLTACLEDSRQKRARDNLARAGCSSTENSVRYFSYHHQTDPVALLCPQKPTVHCNTWVSLNWKMPCSGAQCSPLKVFHLIPPAVVGRSVPVYSNRLHSELRPSTEFPGNLNRWSYILFNPCLGTGCW